MSRAYRIRVKESISRDLAASDEICSDLEILEILPGDQMAELLRRELEQRGFNEEDGKMVRKDKDITVGVDPKTGEVSVKAETKDEVKLDAEREDWGYDDVGPGEEKIRERLSDQLKKDLERKADQQQSRLQNEATEKLEGVMGDLRKELGQAVNRVTAEALKRKAASLGEIKEMTEDPEAGTLTIKVEV
jgi:hypothetical protein